MRIRVLLSCIGLLAGLVSLHAQNGDANVLGPKEVAANLVEYVTPAYPPIAKAAHVWGDVIALVEISTDGSVQDVRIASGPPMLQQATLDAVKRWRYKPFLKGNEPSAIVGKVVVTFTLYGKPNVHAPHGAKEVKASSASAS